MITFVETGAVTGACIQTDLGPEELGTVQAQQKIVVLVRCGKQGQLGGLLQPLPPLQWPRRGANHRTVPFRVCVYARTRARREREGQPCRYSGQGPIFTGRGQ